MRPNQHDYNSTPRYRRRDTSRASASRIVLVLVVAIGIVVGSLILINTHKFNTDVEPNLVPSTSNRDGSGDRASGGDSAVDMDALAADLGSRSGVTGQGSSGPSRQAGAAPADGSGGVATADCNPHGRVTDDWGAPMVNVLIRAATDDESVVEVYTDSRGRYELPRQLPGVVSVSVVLTHGTDSGLSFAVMNGNEVISLTVPVAATGSAECEINFDSWNVPGEMVASPIDTGLWPDAVSIYQYTRDAQELALELGADLPQSAKNPTMLQVQAWCDDPELGCDGSKSDAFFVAENELSEGSPPIIAMLSSRSSAQSPGVPDNREYHEYGHYFLSFQTGENFELPAGDTNHGGYYRNTSTRDSFVEGFAEFYSMMVAKNIEGDDRSEIYTIGADYDLEMDRLPWESEGWWEEFSIAGLLLDLVDSDADYATRTSGSQGLSVLEVTTDVEPSGTIVVGKIANTSSSVMRNADVTVSYLNDAGEVVGRQVTRIVPGIIAPSREGTFYAAPPAGLGVTAATATPGGIARNDDENVTLGLSQLIGIITGYERTDAGGAAGTGVSNVAELYDALVNGDESLTRRSPGSVEISPPGIDEVFINHGFFADLDGDKNYTPEIDGPVGASSHPVVQVGGSTYPALIPRNDPDPYDGSFVTIDTGDSGASAIIQISIPTDDGASSYAYVTELEGSNRVELAVPPANQDAKVTVITAGEDYKPVIAFRVDADDFHEKVENGTIADLQVTPVELESGMAVSQPAVDNTTVQTGIIVGGIVAMALIVTVLLVTRRRWSRSQPQST